MSLDDDTIRRALPELQTLIDGIISVAKLPRTGAEAFDEHLLPLILLCQEIAEKHGQSDTPLMVYLIAMAAAARIPRSIIRGDMARSYNRSN